MGRTADRAIWLAPADVVATSAAARASFLAAPDACTMPRDTAAALAALATQLQLLEADCSVVSLDASALEWDFESPPLQSVSNTMRACAANSGWSAVKGWMLLKAGSGFVAVRHWWCRNAAGKWLDLTAPLSMDTDRALLCEAASGGRGVEAHAMTCAHRDFLRSLLEVIDPPLADSLPSMVADEEATGPATATATAVSSATGGVSATSDHLDVGDVVRVSGLVAKPELNGLVAQVASWDAAKGRHHVRLDASGETLSLKPSNLQRLHRASEADEQVSIEEISTQGMRSERRHAHAQQAGEQQQQQQQQQAAAAAVAAAMAAQANATRASGPSAHSPNVPTYMWERAQQMEEEMRQMGLDDSDSDAEEAGPADVHSNGRFELLTLSLIKLGKLGMRITDTDAPDERGHAVVDSVGEGPAAAAGVQAGDLVVAVNGVRITGGRPDATSKLGGAAIGILTVTLARRKGRAAAGGPQPPGAPPLPRDYGVD